MTVRQPLSVSLLALLLACTDREELQHHPQRHGATHLAVDYTLRPAFSCRCVLDYENLLFCVCCRGLVSAVGSSDNNRGHYRERRAQLPRMLVGQAAVPTPIAYSLPCVRSGKWPSCRCKVCFYASLMTRNDWKFPYDLGWWSANLPGGWRRCRTGAENLGMTPMSSALGLSITAGRWTFAVPIHPPSVNHPHSALVRLYEHTYPTTSATGFCPTPRA